MLRFVALGYLSTSSNESLMGLFYHQAQRKKPAPGTGSGVGYFQRVFFDVLPLRGVTTGRRWVGQARVHSVHCLAGGYL